MTPTILTPTWVFNKTRIPDPKGHAAKMLRFADLLCHPKSEAEDQRLFLAPWQRRIIQRIYGPRDEHGRRAVRKVFVLLPRGNRKTTLGAVLALGHTIGPAQVRGGQVISAASDRSQARIAFDEAAEMLRLDPVLLAATRIRDTKSRIEHPKSRSVYSAISADGDAQHGKTPTLVIADELHVWRGFGLWNALDTGLKKVPGSLLVVITTAGEKPEGICWEMYTYARKVASGEVTDPSFLPVLFEGDQKAPWDDEDNWRAANPGLEYGFPDIDGLREGARLARQLPRLRVAFEQLHLNRWGDGSAAGWIDMTLWDACQAPIDLDALAGRPCWIGVDLSRSFDLTAVVACFRDDDGAYTVMPFAFLPDETLKQRAAESDTPWLEWAEAGHVETIPGRIIRDDVIEAKILDLASRYSVQEVAFDPKFAGKLMVGLEEAGLPVVAHSQSAMHTTSGVVEMQRAILDVKLRHDGNPVMRWCVGNVVPHVNSTGLIRFDKARSADSIDLAQACTMAIGRAMHSDGGTIYGARDFKLEDVLFG